MTEIFRLFIEAKLLPLKEGVLFVFSPIFDGGAVNPELLELIECVSILFHPAIEGMQWHPSWMFFELFICQKNDRLQGRVLMEEISRNQQYIFPSIVKCYERGGSIAQIGTVQLSLTVQ